MNLTTTRLSFRLLVVCSLAILAGRDLALAGPAAADEWRRFAPATEEFTVLMPGAVSTDATELMPGTNARIYSAAASGVVTMLMAIDGGDPTYRTPKAALNSFQANFTPGFIKGMEQRGGKGSLTFVRDVTVDGFAGQELRARLDHGPSSLHGLVRAYLTRKHVYVAIAYYSEAEDEQVSTYFHTSFRLSKQASVADPPPPARRARPADALAARSEWKEFRSDEGAFRILMPGTPTAKTVPVETDAGTLTQQQYMRASEYEVCAITFMEVPPQVFESKGVDQALEDACDGAVREMSVRETQARRAITIQGHPGRAIEAVMQDGSLEFMGRVYIVGTRMFILFYGQRAGRNRTDAERFFTSFALE